MRTITLAIIASCLAALVTINESRADKITVDPNVPGAVTSRAAKQAVDHRLAEKVTYEGGYKRLHHVAEELSAITGVRIRAGRTSKDWRVRDIPLVVCVRDLPLGKLLHALAGCAHVKLAAETTRVVLAGEEEPSEEADKRTYRFYRDKESETAITAPLEAKVQANLALANWAWETLAAYADMPETPLDLPPDKYNFMKIDAEQIRLVSRVLASLGPESREKAFSGEQVTLKTGNASQSALLKKLFNYAWRKPGYGLLTLGVNRVWLPVEPTDQEIQNSLLVIKASRRDRRTSSAGLSLYLHGIPMRKANSDEERRPYDSWRVDPLALARALQSCKNVEIPPPPPEAESVFEAEDVFPSPGFSALKRDADWELPLLQTKVAVQLPDEIEFPTRADVLTELAKASGLNVVWEDFVSHKQPYHSRANVNLDSETTVTSVLRKLIKRYGQDVVTCFADEDAKLVVGWDSKWRKRHQNLVPESLLVRIRAKREGEGAELDDLVPLLQLTSDQHTEWISDSAEYLNLDIHSSVDREQRWVWRLYNMLSLEDKLFAKSEPGLPLGKFDPTWLMRFYQQETRQARERIISFGVPGEHPYSRQRQQFFSDPKSVSTLVMRVTQEPLHDWPVHTLSADGWCDHQTYHPGTYGPTKHTYAMELVGVIDGEQFRMTSKWRDVPFPLYTLEREAQLRKEAEAKLKNMSVGER